MELVNTIKGALKSLILLVFAFLSFLFLYLGSWTCIYRIPAAESKVIDLRKSKQEKACCISFCASLADNLSGFPGHAYLIFSRSEKLSTSKEYSLGFMPRYYRDQIPSLFKSVDGAVFENISGNKRNLDELKVLLSESDFDKAVITAKNWNASRFKTGSKDCVAFVNYMAESLRLKTINPAFVYPQDYLRRLKELN